MGLPLKSAVLTLLFRSGEALSLELAAEAGAGAGAGIAVVKERMERRRVVMVSLSCIFDFAGFVGWLSGR